jgi:thiol-disulfide isomerase/thioredoxin
MTRLHVLVIVGLLGACKAELTPPAGDIAASLALPDLDGKAFDPATLQGKPAVVLFWRTGCSYCKHELPVVSRLAKDAGVTAIAVMVAGDKERALPMLTEFDGTVLVDDGTLRTRYDIKAVPYMLVLRSDGTAARAFKGEQSESTLRSAINGVD